MDLYFLLSSLAFVFALLVFNVYFLARNAHPNDTKFGSHFVLRILVVRDSFHVNPCRSLPSR
jgi:hypothetical protein